MAKFPFYPRADTIYYQDDIVNETSFVVICVAQCNDTFQQTLKTPRIRWGLKNAGDQPATSCEDLVRCTKRTALVGGS